jgi:predicted Zn-dependent protease
MRMVSVVLVLVFLAACAPVFAGEAAEVGEAQAEPVPGVVPPDSPGELTKEEKAEADIGRSAVRELEKKFKLIEDSSELPRLAGIVRKLRPATQRPQQGYELKVVDTKAINAFSLPGGFLYFTRGILEAVESDDELAAVAGHEMAHVCLAHSRKLMSRDEKYQRILGSLLVLSILSNAEGIDPGAIATVAGLVAQDALNHYGREAEFEADQEAVLYLKESGAYNPVAVLTVVEGLARIEGSQANLDMGVFQTHPYGKQRVKAVTEELEALGIPIERRRVTRSLMAEAAQVVKEGREIGELRLNGRLVFQPAAEAEGASPMARAEASAAMFNELLLENLGLLEIMQMAEGDSVLIGARGETLVRITPEDAVFHGLEVAALAHQAMTAIRLGFSEEKVERAY